MSSNFNLKQKIALITGASRGIGFAIADQFAKAGANLIIASRKKEGIEKAKKKLLNNGTQVFSTVVHTGNSDSIKKMVKDGVKYFGGIDIVVNNAATSPHYGPILTSDESHWNKTLDVNIKGYFKVIKASVKSMKKRGGGKIINIASIAGEKPLSGMGIYCISKSAVIMLTKVLAKELSGYDIQVNAIAPGLVKTNFSSILWKDKNIYKKITNSIPVGRMAEPFEISGLALYLASTNSSFTTGEIFTVDGGQTI
tara:strand:- start:3424 stop:4185 length:762 start_codon:yes stop_codon:yes gene_type:complete